MDKVSDQFLRQIQSDPLFAAEGLDLPGAAKAIDLFETECEELEQILKSVSLFHKLFLTRYRLTRYQFPIPFFRAFLESERARREFLADQRYERAVSLIAAWKHTHKQLHVCVERYVWLHRVLCILERKDRSFVYKDMRNNITDFDTISETLSLLRQNTSLLSEEIKYFEALLEDKGRARPVKAAPQLRYDSSPQEATSPDLKRLHLLDETYGFMLRNNVALEKFGPVRHNLVMKPGAKKETHQFYAYILKDQKSGLPVLKITFADHFSFIPISGPRARISLVDRALYQGLIDRGMRYFYQPCNLYVSRDTRFWLDIATIVDLHRRNDLNEQLVLKQKSSLLDMIIGTVAIEARYFNFNMRARVQGGKFKHFSHLFGLLIRSYPGILFLPFNESVWRHPRSPNFLGSRVARTEDAAYVSEREVLADTTPEELTEIMKSGQIREAIWKNQNIAQ